MTLYRFDKTSGRLLGFISPDRDDYSDRDDITAIKPPNLSDGQECAYWNGCEWYVASIPADPGPTLSELKALKRRDINSSWDSANASSFTFSGKQIACDKSSRSDIDGVNSEVALTGALPAAFPGAWKALDNSWVPIQDVATWTLFIQAMVAQGHQNFTRAQQRKAAIEAAQTPEELAAIAW